jgi:hypothetical protein
MTDLQKLKAIFKYLMKEPNKETDQMLAEQSAYDDTPGCLWYGRRHNLRQAYVRGYLAGLYQARGVLLSHLNWEIDGGHDGSILLGIDEILKREDVFNPTESVIRENAIKEVVAWLRHLPDYEDFLHSIGFAHRIEQHFLKQPQPPQEEKR